ncbi:MAG: acyl-CoA dehydrogenase family protein, partial [Steroidobacteraceae bacterium]
MDFSPTEEQQLLIDSARNFVRKELLPHEDVVEREDWIPDDLYAQVKQRALDAGFYAANIATDFGGGGLNALDFTLMEMEFGWVSYALHYIVHRPCNILQAGTPAQIDEYLKPTVRGERLDCIAFSEPGAGSDLGAMSTRAVRKGADYVINGSKHFISFGVRADYVILFAVTDVLDTPRGKRNEVSAFLVDKGTPGFSWRKGPACTSHRGYDHAELFFEDCRVPASRMLGRPGEGFELANKWLSPGRISLGALAVGRARRVLELSAGWAASRKQFGQAIGKFQGTSFKLADMYTELAAAEMLTLRAAWKHDRGSMTDEDAALSNRMVEDVLQRQQNGAAFKLYTDRVFSGGTLSEP